MNVLNFDKRRVTKAKKQNATTVIYVDFKNKQVDSLRLIDHLGKTEYKFDKSSEPVVNLNRKIAA